MTGPGGGGRPRTASAHSERGSVLVGVLVLAVLVAGVALAARALGDARLRAERRRLARERATRLATSAALGVAGWFEGPERGALRGAPPPGLGSRDRRRVDPDGDGRGTPFRDARPPWNVRWKDPPTVPFRPPNGPAPGDRLAGTLDGPDWVLEAAAGPVAADWLAGWSHLLAPDGPARLVRVALSGPRPGAGAAEIGRVLAEAEVALPGAARPVRVAVVADLVAVPWGALRRPLVVARDARLEGDVAWRWGEAVVGGDLVAPAGIEDRWPGGIPWAGPDRPLRRDQDGDGTEDDVDGDGTGDWASWRDLPGPVPDPWWRARVGGAWRGRFAPGGSCVPPWPFGPRASPPHPPTRSDRSGFFVRCPVAGVASPVPDPWWALAGAGVRGTARLVEDPAREGWFRLDGAGEPVPLATLLAKTSGLRRVEIATGRAGPLALALEGLRGGILVRGAAVRAVAGTSALRGGDAAPPDPPDTGGEDRGATPGDPRLGLDDPDGACRGFVPREWAIPGTAPVARPCPARHVDLVGLLSVEGTLQVTGGLLVAGQVRAGELLADGGPGPVRFLAVPAPGGDPPGRPGVPGAPLVLAVAPRRIPSRGAGR